MVDEIATTFLSKYFVFADIFSLKLKAKFLEYVGINNYTINLMNSKQPPHWPIYSLKTVELKILKGYIEINSA